ASDLERRLEIHAIDDIEAEELLLGLGERAVDHQGPVASLAQGGGGGGRQEAGDGAEAALLRPLLLGGDEPADDGVILLLAPGADDILLIVAKDRIEHRILPW